MKSLIGSTLSLILFAWPIHSGEPFRLPKTATPAITMVRKVDREKQEVSFAVISISMQQPKNDTDKKKPPEPPIVRRDLQEFTTGLKGFKFVTVGGKELSDKDGWERLKVGSVVITTSDPKGVDPVFRAVLAPDALMLVPIGWEESQPIPKADGR